jgi:hypothetical protein
MSVSSKRKMNNRKEDKTDLVVVLIAVLMVGIATLLYVNSKRAPVTNAPAVSATALKAPNTNNAPNANQVVGGKAFSVGAGSTDSSSTSHTENGDGS